MEIKPKTNIVSPVILAKFKIKDILLFIILLFLLFATLYFYFSYHKLKKEMYVLTNPQAQAAVNKAEANQLVAELSKVMSLPIDEEPVVGTIKDVDNLVKTQKFFVGAQNGDKIIIYKDKAIIYRQETKKIINVGPVYIDTNKEAITDNDTSATSTVDSITSSTDKISVEVRNGSGLTGAASDFGSEIDSLEGYRLDKVGDAATTSYSGIWIVNLSAKNLESLLAKVPNAQVVDKLPENEKNSQDDVVVIIGKNQ